MVFLKEALELWEKYSICNVIAMYNMMGNGIEVVKSIEY